MTAEIVQFPRLKRPQPCERLRVGARVIVSDTGSRYVGLGGYIEFGPVPATPPRSAGSLLFRVRLGGIAVVLEAGQIMPARRGFDAHR